MSSSLNFQFQMTENTQRRSSTQEHPDGREMRAEHPAGDTVHLSSGVFAGASGLCHNAGRAVSAMPGFGAFAAPGNNRWRLRPGVEPALNWTRRCSKSCRRALRQAALFRKQFQWHGHRLYAVDGSKSNLLREWLKWGDRTFHDGHYPQTLVSTFYQLHSRTTLDFELAAHDNERQLALTHLQWSLSDTPEPLL